MTDTERARAIVETTPYITAHENDGFSINEKALIAAIAHALQETREAAARVCCEAADRSDIGAVASALRGAADTIRAGGG